MKICICLSPSKTQYFVNQAYIAFLTEAGLEPVAVTPHNEVQDYVDFCDGLLLPGGIDIDPTHYGECNIASYKVDPKKDDFERQLLQGFLTAGKKVFGICRGFQLVMREYLLEHPKLQQYLQYYQHVNGHEQTGGLSLDRDVYSHDIRYIPEGLYGEGGQNISVNFVNSMHHQAVVGVPPKKRPNAMRFGDVFVVASSTHGMKADEKGYIVEAVRFQWGNSEVLAVQWHPEELMDTALIGNFFTQETPAFLTGGAGG